MSKTIFKQACQVFPHRNYLSRKQVWRNRVKWIRAIRYLGDKWLLAKSIPRKDQQYV